MNSKWSYFLLLVISTISLYGYFIQRNKSKRLQTELEAVSNHMIEAHQSEDSLKKVIDSLLILTAVEAD